MQAFIFTPNCITWYIQTFILHTKAYCSAHAKHSYCTPVYKTRASFDVSYSCVRFDIVRSFDKAGASSARDVSTANCLCYSHTQNLLKWPSHYETHTWGLRWCATSWCWVNCKKYGCNIPVFLGGSGLFKNDFWVDSWSFCVDIYSLGQNEIVT